jgi:hypothetical protein
MSDIGPYGVTQNADAEAVTADALVGERAGNVTAHQAGAGYSPASFSTAPYIPPSATAKPHFDLCRFKNCRQPLIDGSDYCLRHAP